MEILIINESSHSIPRRFVKTWIDNVCLELQKRKLIKCSELNRELTLVFLSPKKAKKINFEFRARSYATDVLSFESVDPDSFGELILCPEVLKRQAKNHGLSFRAELGYMLLHGILHLLGYDHEKSDREARVMFGLQDSIFEELLREK
jgi:probable rRNA maturation factor